MSCLLRCNCRALIAVVPVMIALLLTAGCAVQPPRPDASVWSPVQPIGPGSGDWTIVVPADASPATRRAADELQAHLAEMSGVTLPILDDSDPLPERAMLIGADNRHVQTVAPHLSWEGLGREGYRIRSQGDYLILGGPGERSNLYAVYGLLEDYLGVRWFTPTVRHVPRQSTVSLGPLDVRHVPPLEYREPFTTEAFDGDWAARNRMNSSSAALTEQHGGKIRFGDGFFVHTFDRLVPPDKYFDDYPEYFSLIDGERLKDRSQLCCSNEDVIRLCTEGILEAMRRQPDAFVFSVSQNDWYNYCQCDACQAIALAEESQIGPVLALVNQVAEAVEAEFPDKAVETLAYQWTRQAPKHMRPRPNVIIRLCSIECCFAHPLDQCDSPENQAFRKDAEAWAQVSDRLWVWNYATSFTHYLLPFPNQRVRRPNTRFYIANNVTGIFEQDCYNTLGSELAELGAWLTAKFLWDPDYDEDLAMGEFLEGVYGPDAAPFIRQWINLLHDRVEQDNIHMNIWVGPDGAHLTDDLLAAGDTLWAQAEQAVWADPDRFARVRKGRMSVDYAILERALMQEKKTEDLARRLDRFMDALEAVGVTRLHEWTSLDREAYRRRFDPLLGS